MTRIKRVLTVLNHKEPDEIPGNSTFFDINSYHKFVPKFDIYNWKRNEMEYIEFMDSYITEAGHGELRSKIIERRNNYHIIGFENGARWRITEFPFNRDYVYYPIQDEKDIDKMVMPNADDPERYNGTKEGDGRQYREDGRYVDDNDLSQYVSVEERVKFYKSQDLFIIGTINGFFSGVWYFWRDFENFLTDLAIREGFAIEMIKRVAEYNLEAARNLLERGVNAIRFNDDLGSTNAMLISPKFYEKYFYPWHKKLADLCHQYRAYAYMHSHGNINEIMDLIISAGIDILNPVGPTDNMNLRELKTKYGKKITFCGGISKLIGGMTKDEIKTHIEEVVRIGSVGGGFIPKEEGGLPYSMGLEDFGFYMKVLKECRKKYGKHGYE